MHMFVSKGFAARFGSSAVAAGPIPTNNGAGDDGHSRSKGSVRNAFSAAGGTPAKSGEDQSAQADLGGGATAGAAVQESAREDQSHEDQSAAGGAADGAAAGDAICKALN